MESLWTPWTATACATFGLFGAGWIASVWRRDASLVDRIWGVGFVMIAWVLLLQSELWQPRQLLMATMVSAWGLRLSLHLTRRNWGHGEDYRYVAMRQRHGDRFWWVSLWTVFTLQGVLQWLISLPIQLTIIAPGEVALGPLDGLGLALFAAGFAIEAVGDRQLRHFKAHAAAGEVMDRGLWRYSRHPNYFGEALLWWGIYGVACAVPGGVWTFPAPALMTLLLLRVSGVPLLEAKLKRTRPGYAGYVARTSAFVPWPPREPVDPGSAEPR